MAMPDVRLGQRRSVVDAVADHRHPLSLLLQRRDVPGLLLREDLGEDAVDPQLARHRLARAAVVARHHDDLDPGLPEAGDCLPRARPDGVSHGQNAGGPTINGDVDRSPTGGRQRLDALIEGGDIQTSVAHELGVADEDRVTLDSRLDTMTGDCRKCLG